MENFTKAFSPLYEQFVTIKKIRRDTQNSREWDWIIDAQLPTGEVIAFRRNELTNYS